MGKGGGGRRGRPVWKSVSYLKTKCDSFLLAEKRQPREVSLPGLVRCAGRYTKNVRMRRCTGQEYWTRLRGAERIFLVAHGTYRGSVFEA